MVELAALAMHQEAAPSVAWESLSEYSRFRVRKIARAAIEAMREPTEAMNAVNYDNGEGAEIWRAMIDAALK